MIDSQQVQDAKRVLGETLARLRNARGLTQADVATRVHSSRSTIAGVESGQQVVDRIFWQRCEDLLGGDGQLLAGYDHYRRTRQRYDEEKAAAAQRARWGEAERYPRAGDEASIVSTPAPLAGIPAGVPAVVERVINSRDVLGGRDQHDRVGGLPQRAITDVDPALVLHWTEMLRLLASSHNVFGSRRVYDVACRESAVIRHYRREATADVGLRLLAVEARWAEFASWTADNLGHPAAGVYWLDRALGLAQRVGDKRMAAYVLMRQAQQAADQLDGVRAETLAGVAETTDSLTDRDRALCLIRRAQGHALRGDRRGARVALDAAHRLTGQTIDVDDDPDTIGHHCTAAYVWAHEGYCLLRLGQAEAAVRRLQDVLEGWPADYRQDEALVRAWLALSYAAVDRLTDAGAEGRRALTLATATSSARAMRTLSQLYSRLPAGVTSAEVAGFREAFVLVSSARRI